MPDHAALYRQLYTIRRFEETVLDAFPKGAFYGTTHTYIGQEANAVGVLAHLNEGDIVFSNHRCHGHFIAYGGDLRALFAELMGKATGVCGGLGGSQHLHWKDFYSNGVLGSTAPIAVGTALAEKQKGSDAITVLFLGDGALGEGTVYESLNIASLWNAPILFVVENNHIAQTTPTELALAGSLAARFAAFGIPVVEMDSNDVAKISSAAQHELAELRATRTPRALVLNTTRFGPHSKGDDTRDPAYIEELRTRLDPLTLHAAQLPASERQAIESEVDTAVAAAYAQAEADPPPPANHLAKVAPP
ncbi:MAG: thiamine pyrophosphate-dependent dehydrogenase E1 component subunit alpha [Anaerolineales bacterium]|nr:thiamine pyrophosphate-dependent dehydrogenase E1 component subunit alpha [Anaerolineales bacterium]